MLAYALVVLALQIATSLPMPTCSGNRECSTCCISGPNTRCDRSESNNVHSVFDTDFSMTHTGSQAVPDETSLVMYANDGQTEVSCWEHNQTYTVELRSERYCPMKGFMLQLHPDSRGSIPDQIFETRVLQSIGCDTITHRSLLTTVRSPQVVLKYKAPKNRNHRDDLTFRYIVVYSTFEHVQTSRSFPACESTEPPITEATPCSDDATPTVMEEDSEMEESQYEDSSETVVPNDLKQKLGPPTSSSETPTDEEEPEEDGSDQPTEQEEVGTTCGRSRPLSNWTRLYNDTTTGIQYTCNIVTPMINIQCTPTCEAEHEGRNVSLCCGVKKYQPRRRRFNCEACSNESAAPVTKTFEILIPKQCSCWECEGSAQ